MKQPCIADLFSDQGHDVPQPKQPSDVVKELERLNAAALRVLAMLKLRGDEGCLNWELCTTDVGGLNGMARLRELRADGWDITKEHVEGGTWRYTLKGLRGQ